MKQIIHRLLDAVWPWRVIAGLNKACALWEETHAMQKTEIAHLTRERDTARRQFAETKTVNLSNAAVHRATEVAMLRQNHALQAAEARLVGKTPHPELAAAAKEVPALRVPVYLPVEQPKQVSP